MSESPISEIELHAYIDGELDAERAKQIAAQIADSAGLAERVALYRADLDLIGRAYGPLIDRPLPEALMRALAEKRPQPSSRRAVGFISAIAATLAIAVIAWGAYPYIFATPGDRLVAEAIAARDGDISPAEELPVALAADPAALDRLIETTLAVPAKVPDLGKAGYTLTDMKVYPDRSDGRGLQLTYRDAGGRLFTLYMHRPTGGDRFELSQRGQMQESCIWQSDELGVVMLGEMSAKEMLRVATLTYADLNF